MEVRIQASVKPMRFISHHIVFLIVLMVIVFVCMAGSAVAEAWMDVRKKPREEMFWCSTCRTYFRKKHCLPLFPELGGKAQNSFVCPSCYYKAVFVDPDKKLKSHV